MIDQNKIYVILLVYKFNDKFVIMHTQKLIVIPLNCIMFANNISHFSNQWVIFTKILPNFLKRAHSTISQMTRSIIF